MPPKPAILFLDHAAGLGGAEYSLLLILEYLDRSRWTPHLVCSSGSLAQAAERLGVTVHVINYPRLRRSPSCVSDLIMTTWTIAQLALTCDAALMHANTIRSSLYTAVAARLIRRPFVWHMRDFGLSEQSISPSWIDQSGKRWLCRMARTVICNSRAVADQLPCQDKVQPVLNGIKTASYVPHCDASLFRATCGLPSGALVVGMVGRLRPWKGQVRFLEMAAMIRSILPQTYFLVVGGDPFQVNDGYAQQLQAICAELDLGDRVIFTGQIEDVRPALAAMDVFVHPGDPEPFGLVNLEAMAMAKPVVAFAHGALSEIVQNGVTGCLVPPTDVPCLAAAVVELLGHSEKRAEMGAAGRFSVEANFSIEGTVRKIEDIYERILRP